MNRDLILNLGLNPDAGETAFLSLDDDFVVLDTETTGLTATAEIVELGLIDSQGQPLIDTFVKPLKPIPAEATAIHGITDEMVADAPTWPEVLGQLIRATEGKLVVIFNAGYDVRLLEQTTALWGIDVPVEMASRGFYCAMLEYAAYKGVVNPLRRGYKWWKLGVAAEMEGVPPGTAHRAVGDCETTLGVIRAVQAKLQKNIEVDHGVAEMGVTDLAGDQHHCHHSECRVRGTGTGEGQQGVPGADLRPA